MAKHEMIENPKIDEFLEQLQILCKEHGLSISHEDSQGAFIIEGYDKDNIEWIKLANDGIDCYGIRNGDI
jgi:hypothetical protein